MWLSLERDMDVFMFNTHSFDTADYSDFQNLCVLKTSDLFTHNRVILLTFLLTEPFTEPAISLPMMSKGMEDSRSGTNQVFNILSEFLSCLNLSEK